MKCPYFPPRLSLPDPSSFLNSFTTPGYHISSLGQYTATRCPTRPPAFFSIFLRAERAEPLEPVGPSDCGSRTNVCLALSATRGNSLMPDLESAMNHFDRGTGPCPVASLTRRLSLQFFELPRPAALLLHQSVAGRGAMMRSLPGGAGAVGGGGAGGLPAWISKAEAVMMQPPSLSSVKGLLSQQLLRHLT